jgi:hypothetical protein
VKDRMEMEWYGKILDLKITRHRDGDHCRFTAAGGDISWWTWT